MVRYRKFPLVDLWGALLNIASWQIPPLLFAAFFNAASVGLYALAFRFIQLPMSLIGAAISQVFYPRLAAVRAAGAPLGPHAEGLFHRLTVLGLFPALLCAAAGPGLFGWVFGEAWREAGQYARILSPWVWVWFISSPLSVLFNTLERQGRLLGFQMLIFGSRLLAIFLGSRLGDMRLALTLFSLSGALVYGALCVDALRLAGARTGNCLRGLGPAFAAATLLGLPVYALQRAEVPGLWLTAAAGAASVVYFLCAFWLDVELRTLVRGWKNRMQEPTP
jgi:O-antigen/teichoic acid export membrane protein